MTACIIEFWNGGTRERKVEGWAKVVNPALKCVKNWGCLIVRAALEKARRLGEPH